MFIIGERINGMYKDVKEAIQKKEKKVIQDWAIAQSKAGANALDINIGPASPEPLKVMPWLVEIVQEVTDVTLCLDSPKIEVTKEGLKACKRPAIINSTTGQQEKLDQYLPLTMEYNASLIGLTIDEKGIPKDIDTRVEIAARLLASAIEHGLSMDRLFIDPIVMPVNVAQPQAPMVLEAIKQFTLLNDPSPHIVLGLSNLSQGAAERDLINRTFIAMAIQNGLDAAIMDANDKEMIDALATAELLLNKTIYSDSFLKAYISYVK